MLFIDDPPYISILDFSDNQATIPAEHLRAGGPAELPQDDPRNILVLFSFFLFFPFFFFAFSIPSSPSRFLIGMYPRKKKQLATGHDRESTSFIPFVAPSMDACAWSWSDV
jgi:hypothetical protein